MLSFHIQIMQVVSLLQVSQSKLCIILLPRTPPISSSLIGQPSYILCGAQHDISHYAVLSIILLLGLHRIFLPQHQIPEHPQFLCFP